MEIHRYELAWFGLSLLLITGFVATITYGAVGAGVTMVDESGGSVAPDALADHPEFGDPGVERVGTDRYAVHVVARQFVFQPETVVVPADSSVTFYVTSADVMHGFAVVGTNANTMVIPGQVAELTVRVEEPREYGIVCHEYCGAAHHTMAGTLRVVPADEYAGDDR